MIMTVTKISAVLVYVVMGLWFGFDDNDPAVYIPFLILAAFFVVGFGQCIIRLISDRRGGAK